MTDKQLKEEVRRLVTPIFEKALKEAPTNHRIVGFNEEKEPITFLWQPHNYRLYFDFSKENFNPKKPSNHTLEKYKSMVGIFNKAYTYTSLNYDSEHKYEKFMFCTIRVKKTQVEVTNFSYNKQWVLMKASSVEEIDLLIDKRMNELREKSKEALKAFIELHGGFSNFNILNERGEHGIHGEDYLDKIPREMIINDTYFKKVYKKKVEFKDIAAVKNYISNRSIEKIAPSLAKSINNLAHKMCLVAPLRALKQRLRNPLEVLLPDNVALVELLNPSEKEDLGQWLFTLN